MPFYHVWVRRQGDRNAQPEWAFVIDAVDYREGYEKAMQTCFQGATVVDTHDQAKALPARRWTVARVDLVKPNRATSSDPNADLKPKPELRTADRRERELSRLYAGRQYDDVKLRRTASRTAEGRTSEGNVR